MDIKKFINNSVFNFPGFRGKKDIRKYLRSRYDDYLSFINSIQNNSEHILIEIKDNYKFIEESCNNICESINKYLLGDTVDSYNYIDKAINNVLQYFVRFAGNDDTNSLNKIGHLYRVRLGSYKEFTKKDLFHIPFELRYKVVSQRFSIHGLPCLYFGSSLYVCWEELNRPSFDLMHISRFNFKPDKSVRMITIGPSPTRLRYMIGSELKTGQEKEIGKKWILQFAICWPIILACSLKVPDTTVPFKSEYIIPQLVLQWVRNNKSIDGIQYPSLRVNYKKVKSTLALNYTFPTQDDKNDSGICSKLSAMFVLTPPVSWTIVKVSDLRASVPITNTADISLIPGLFTNYERTEFGYVQNIINEINTESI